MENNLHINERLEKQPVAELLQKRREIAPKGDVEALNKLMDEIVAQLVMAARYIAPAVVSSGEKQEITFQMIKSPQGVNFFPIFTSSEDLDVWEDMRDSTTVQLGFDNYAKLLAANESIGGIAVNPFTDNIRVDRRLVAQWFERKQAVIKGYTSHAITSNSKYEFYAPSPYPFQLSDKLCEKAKEIPEIQRIWLRGIKLDGNDGYLAVVEFEGETGEILPPLGETAKPYLNGLPIHFVPYNSDFGEQAVKDILPVYAK